MSVIIKRATLWVTETPNTPGVLGAKLGPLADQGVDLDLLMGYSHPDKSRATIEVFPVTDARAQRAARAAGFSKAPFPCVVITGPNRAGLGRDVASALADAGININFFVAQVIGRKYTGMFSFEADSEADLAVRILRAATRRRPAVRANGSGRSPRVSKSARRGSHK